MSLVFNFNGSLFLDSAGTKELKMFYIERSSLHALHRNSIHTGGCFKSICFGQSLTSLQRLRAMTPILCGPWWFIAPSSAIVALSLVETDGVFENRD